MRHGTVSAPHTFYQKEGEEYMEREPLLRIKGEYGDILVIQPLQPSSETELDELYALLLEASQHYAQRGKHT